jgi:glycosyltransferase involved in cell wall biosynthesis
VQIMNNRNKNLYLFTYAYPFGEAESFLENEIPFLSQSFSKVYVVPSEEGGTLRRMPSNFELLSFKKTRELPLRKLLIQSGLFALKIWLMSVLKSKNTRERKFYLKNKKVRLLDLLLEVHNAKKIVNYLQVHGLKKADVLYTYWMRDNAVLLSWAKQRHWIRNRLITRIHGFDFRFEQHPKGFFPYRNMELKGYDKIAAVSDYAHAYMRKKYRLSNNKITTYRLGVSGIDTFASAPIVVKKEYNFVSCSYLIPRKRVDWVFKALTDFALKNEHIIIHWYHIGEGQCFNDLQAMVAKRSLKNLHINLLGNYKNQDIKNFYQTHSFDAFFHCADGEGGCAVAIQEAFSAGIPMMGVANGGVVEMVNENNSISVQGCVTDDYTILTPLLDKFINLNFAQKNTLKHHAFKTWETRFNADNNFLNFIQHELQ